MPTISARVVLNPQRARKCASCGLYIFGAQLKLYGNAHYSEKPYNLHLHIECGDPSCDKVIKVIDEYNRRMYEVKNG